MRLGIIVKAAVRVGVQQGGLRINLRAQSVHMDVSAIFFNGASVFFFFFAAASAFLVFCIIYS